MDTAVALIRNSPDGLRYSELNEIVSAEIKLDPSQAITAFGQAVSYRLFSTQVYLVGPKTMPREDSDRIEALCMLCGIGLVLFNPEPAKPDFTIRVRSQKNRPDMFYVNEFARKLHDHDERLFTRRFG